MIRKLLQVLLAGGLVGLTATSAAAQERRPDLAAQREALQKFAFLVGEWEGEAVVTWGPGEPVRIRQHELVQFKLDGLLLLIEGTGRNAEGRVVFSALATVAYDEMAKSYRFRSHSGGRHLETSIEVTPGGFAWGHTAGPMTMRHVMHLDEAGEWVETTETKFGDQPARRTLEMRLRKVR